MKKTFFTLIFSAFTIVAAFSQDLIILSTGEQIQAKVEEISEEYVKYKKQDFLAGPSYSISIYRVCRIELSNGSVENYCDPNDKNKKHVYGTPKQKKTNQGSKFDWTRHHISVAGSYSMPLGEFGSGGADSLPRAENGYGFQVGYRFFAKEWLGWDLSYGMAFMNSIENTQDILGAIGGLGGLVQVNVKEGSWTLSQITTGPVFDYGITKRWHVSASPKVGVLLSSAPKLAFDGSGNIVIISITFNGERKIESGSSFLYGGDLRFSYRLSDRLSLFAFGDYISSSATQNSVTTLTTSLSGTTTLEDSYNFNYSYLNTGIGLVFTF
jgi:hypothetical protein